MMGYLIKWKGNILTKNTVLLGMQGYHNLKKTKIAIK